MTIRPLTPADAPAVARLHVNCLQGLLHELGEPVATAFYRAACRLPESVALVAEGAGGPGVAGFVLATTESDGYYRKLLRTAPVELGGQLAWRLLTRPALLGRLGGGEPAHGPEALFLAVDPAARGQGLGGALLRAMEEALRQRGAGWYELSVERDNARAIAVYEHLGLRLTGEFQEFGLARRRYRKELA